MANLNNVISRCRDSQHGTKSVLKPCAQSTKLLQPAIGLSDRIMDYINSIVNEPTLSPAVKALVTLQFTSGLRISELLAINPSDVNKFGQIKIKGLKRSNDRFISPVYYIDYWQDYGAGSMFHSDYYSRFYIYRLYKKKGIYSMLGNGGLSSVTHLPRHLYIKFLSESGQDVESTRQIIGHKKTSNTEIYLKSNK